MRKGLGIGRGRGYYNLVPQDHLIHSLSAKGIKHYSKQELSKTFSDFNLIVVHDKDMDGKEGFALETKDEPNDRSNAIFTRIPEAKSVQAIRNMANGHYYAVLFAKGSKGKLDFLKGDTLTDYKTYTIYRLDRYAENMEDDEYGEHQVGQELYLVGEDEEEEFGEWMADEYGYQDYGNKISLHKLGRMKGGEIMEVAKKYHMERKKTPKYKLDAKQMNLFGDVVPDVEVEKALDVFRPQDKKKVASVKSPELRVKEKGEQIVSMIKGINDPMVEDVVLDDYGNYSGQIFVKLKSTDAGRGKILLGNYDNFVDGKKFNLSKVTKKLSSVLKKNDAKIMDVPKRQYSYTGKNYPKEFEGYNGDYIKIDYEV
jgi:hypothetical protein